MFKIVVLGLLVALASATRFDNKIVGGDRVNIADYPYQVSLQNNGTHMCGGSILNKRQIVTAAHCTEGFSQPGVLNIRAGSSFHSRDGQVIAVANINDHKNYATGPFHHDYDISVLTLADDLRFNSLVQPIPLAMSEPKEGTGVITGWGAAAEGGNPKLQLQKVEVPIMDKKLCESFYPRKISANMICAGLEEGGTDSCSGDSGGPLVINGKLAGVISWGRGCGRPNLPGIYANVATLLKQDGEFNY